MTQTFIIGLAVGRVKPTEEQNGPMWLNGNPIGLRQQQGTQFHPRSPKVTQAPAEGRNLRSLQNFPSGVPGAPGFGALGWKVTQATQAPAEGRNPTS